MHSRIIELRRRADMPSQLTEYDIPEWFNNYSDYVVDSENTSGDIKWFLDFLEKKGVQVNYDAGSFSINRKTPLKYFKSEYKDFKKALWRLLFINFQGFAGYIADKNNKKAQRNRIGCSSLVREIQDFYEDKYGFWVWYRDEVNDYDELITIDDFIRMCLYSTDESGDTTFYIGHTLDYHY